MGHDDGPAPVFKLAVSKLYATNGEVDLTSLYCMHDGIERCSQPWLFQYHDPHPVIQFEMLKGAAQVH